MMVSKTDPMPHSGGAKVGISRRPVYCRKQTVVSRVLHGKQVLAGLIFQPFFIDRHHADLLAHEVAQGVPRKKCSLLPRGSSVFISMQVHNVR